MVLSNYLPVSMDTGGQIGWREAGGDMVQYLCEGPSNSQGSRSAFIDSLILSTMSSSWKLLLTGQGLMSQGDKSFYSYTSPP